MKIKTTGREMKDAECEFISLVPRGANQIPFRIIKSDTSQESTMDITNFHRLLKRESAKKAAVAPTIIGLVVRKGEGFEDAKLALVASGFSVESVVEKADADVSIFLQDGHVEADLGDASMVSLKGEEVMVALKGFSSWTDSLKTFSDKVSAQGFYPSMTSALDVLEDSLYQEASDGDGQDKTIADITDVISQFQTYMLGLIKAVPAQAFKAERALKAVKIPSQGAKNTNGDPKEKAMAEAGSQDPNVHQHGKGGEATTAVNQDVMPPAKKSFSVIDPEELANALKIEDAGERDAAVKAVMLKAPVVQEEDGPGEAGMNGTSSDKPTNYVSMISKAAKPAFEGAKPFKKKDDASAGDEDDATKAAKAVEEAEAAKKAELPTVSVDQPVGDSSNPVMEALKGQLTGISELLLAMKTDLDLVKTTQAAQEAQIVNVVSKTEQSIATLSSTVMGSAGSSVEQPTQVRQPSARKNEGGIQDTAFGGKSVFGSR